MVRHAVEQFMKIKYYLQFGLIKLSLITLLCLSNIVRAQEPDIPSFYTDNIYSIPDMTQTDKRANFPDGGSQF